MNRKKINIAKQLTYSVNINTQEAADKIERIADITEKINIASKELFNIIKTIDTTVLQTKILSLNASIKNTKAIDK